MSWHYLRVGLAFGCLPTNMWYEFLTLSKNVQSFVVFYIPGPISTSYPTHITQVQHSIINYSVNLFHPYDERKTN
jgi:hypothetical protein